MVNGTNYRLYIVFCLMNQAETYTTANELKMIGLQNGILLNITAESVIRIMPPLIISESKIELLVEKLVMSVNQFVGG